MSRHARRASARGRRRLGALAVALVTAAASCSSGLGWQTPEMIVADRITFSPTGEATRATDVTLVLYGTKIPRHYALDELSITDPEVTWTTDGIDLVEGAWPVTAEAPDTYVSLRRVRLRSHATATPEQAGGATVHVRLRMDEGVTELATLAEPETIFQDCPPGEIADVLAGIGATLGWQAETSGDAIDELLDLASDPGGAVWLAGRSADAASPAVRLTRAAEGESLATTEAIGTAARIAVMPDGTATLATSQPGAEGTRVARYDAALKAVWTRTLGGGVASVPATIAVSSGRALVSMSGSAPLFLDGVEVAPATSALGRLALFDTASGELLSLADAGHVVDAVGLPDGGFAFASLEAAAPTLTRIDADGAPAWTTPLARKPTALLASLDGALIVETAAAGAAAPPEAQVYGAAGELLSSRPLPFAGSIALAADASGDLFVAAGSIARVAPDGTATIGKVVPLASWCSTSGRFAVAPTPAGVAFAFVPVTMTAAAPALLGEMKP